MMKKRISYALAGTLAAGLFTWSACNKKENAALKPVIQNPSLMSGSAFTYYTLGTDILESDFLDNLNDPADQNFNYLNHAMTVGLLEIYKNNTALMAEIVTKIEQSKNQQVNLYELGDQYPVINNIMNAVFTQRFSDFSGNWQTYVTANYKYDISYVPFIGFMNIGAVSTIAAPYVSEPFEINEEKFPQFNNDYPLWIKNGNTLLFSTINEEMGYDTKNPIIAISNGLAGDDIADYERLPMAKPGGPSVPFNPGHAGPPPGPQPLQEFLTHVKFQVNERYENTGKSEYRFAYIATAGEDPGTLAWHNFPSSAHIGGMDLSSSQIGVMQNLYFDVFSKYYYQPATNFIFDVRNMPGVVYNRFAVGAFEYDWGFMNLNAKKVFSVKEGATTGGSWTEYKGGRKYYSEWYFIDASTNNGYAFNVRNLNQHTSFWSYTKGVLQLHRWNM
ncbi:MAG: hypothetical protein EOP54_06885 [Sphingobacteriales bacterium]|nr:MAG: hypothetical protein EOP54_06885 [Sphingobacteriales bacterium]